MFEDVSAVLFDLDGTVYYGDEAIPGAVEAIEACRESGRKVFFLTNNSTKTRAKILARLRGMGVPCEEGEILSSGYVSALYARQMGLDGIYVCGTDDLRLELEAEGVEIGAPEDARSLLIGYDPAFDYGKLTVAVRVAMRADLVVACNKEKTFLGAGALPYPGCGAMVAPIEWCSGRGVDYLVGKPNTLLLEVFCREFGHTAADILMVGDTYGSDVLMANRFGCRSVLVSNNVYADTVSIGSIGDLAHLIG